MKELIITTLTILFVGCYFSRLAAQTDSTTKTLTFSGYVETYYAYDFSTPASHNRPFFIYSYNRHNEFNLNLGLIKAAFAGKKTRANLALMAGTYANANLAAEPGVLQNVFEANAGVKISKNREIWVDAGIFPSHIGFESAIGKDCWSLTRGMIAESSPYYESGVKIGYTTDNQQWFFSALVLNGWQRIQRPEGNQTPAFGHQITFKPNERLTLNSSSFIGNDLRNETRRMRYFHNFYGIFQLNPQIGLTYGIDAGAQQQGFQSNEYDVWVNHVFMLRVSASDRTFVNLRAEYYDDPQGIIIYSGTPNGFKTFGYSVNVDYQIHEQALWRLEARRFISRDELFQNPDGLSNSNFCITSALAISF